MGRKRDRYPIDTVLKYWPSTGEVALFDLEVTSWPGAFESGWGRPNQHREIIEIGAIILDCDNCFKEVRNFTCYVKPHLNPSLSSYISNLTGITQGTIDNRGASFPQALGEFAQFIGSDIPLWSHGGDGNILHENCEIHSLKIPFRQEQLFNIAPPLLDTLGAPAGIGASDYPKFLDMNLEDATDIRPHRAIDDVRIIARILRELRTELRI